MNCRIGCGACCIALSISSPISGMPDGKPAGVRCIQLSSENRCKLYGKPERPRVCDSLRANREMCGENTEDAFRYIARLEELTAPADRPTHAEGRIAAVRVDSSDSKTLRGSLREAQ
ncbi:MAG TPA: YkgJ family cysteine cluster protein [Spirochaetia bacterium]|nr:YkgJ family cysteine cluster protein [Spirochaetia bacterium]